MKKANFFYPNSEYHSSPVAKLYLIVRRSSLVPGPGSRRHQVHVCLRGPPGEARHRRGGQEGQLNPQYRSLCAMFL